jgi:acyl-CoA synthetase (AMP-forming)/AMP-acid ligase II
MYGFSTLMSTLLHSGEVILERSTITAQEIWAYLRNEKIAYLPLIRSFVQKLEPIIKTSNRFFKNLMILNASDRLYKNHVDLILQICPSFRNNFGQTEAAPRIFSLEIHNETEEIENYFSKNAVVALGKIVDPKIQIQVRKEDGSDCKPGEVGALFYRSPYAMKGYLSPEGNLEKHDWICSGDLVYRNENEVIFWVGRKNEIIKIDGKYTNIGLMHKYFDSLEAVEKSYFVHDDELGLLGYFISSGIYTEEITKVIVRTHYRKQFPNYPRIDALYSVDQIPSTLSGKVKYSELVALTKTAKEIEYAQCA